MKEPLRVCHLVSDDGWGGAEAVTAGLLGEQVSDPDLRVGIVSLNPGRLTDLARELGITTYVVPEEDRGFLALWRDVGRVLGQLNPDIVHSHRYKENTLNYLLSRRLGHRPVVTLHGDEPPNSFRLRLRRNIWRKIAKWMALRVDAQLVAVSEDLRTVLDYPVTHCRVIPNGVRVPPPEEAPPSKGRIVGWVGRMVQIKDLPLLLQAFAEVARHQDECELLLIGDGPERNMVERLIETLGIRDRTTVTGFVEDPSIYFSRISLFTLTSLHEGVPLALLEAMANGIPCLCAAVGGIPDVAGEQHALELVEERTAAAWAGAITELLRDPQRARELAERGRERVANSFSLRSSASRYKSLYLETVVPE